jgi:hypothetical protein
MTAHLKETSEFRRGRLGEILQFYWYRSLGVRLLDLADRTHKRAPLIHDARILPSPDTLGRKSAEFFVEFKTKTQHHRWNGGGPNDIVRVSPRDEEGIDELKWRQYLEVQNNWKKPVVLSILSIKEATIIAATLAQLGDPRFSPNGFYKFVNWQIASFNLIASLDDNRLHRFFYGEQARLKDLRQSWLERMPGFHEVKPVLDWMRPQQREFEILRQFIFDQIEGDWHWQLAKD